MDVCRQSIVFNSIEDIVCCLRNIVEDQEVIAIRAKNRLLPGYAAAASAGYRDVSLNLSLSTAETRNLGVDCHVCEVQLILRSFAELKVCFHVGF